MTVYFIENKKIILQLPESEILTYQSSSEDIPGYFEKVIFFCQDWLKGEDNFSFQTSGSTGKPTTIQLSRDQMKTSAQMTLEALHLSPKDAAFVSINTSFIGGKMMLVRGMEGDMDLYVCEPSSNPLQHLPENTSIDFFSFVPFQLATMLDQHMEYIQVLNAAKATIIGGAPVSAKLENAVQAIQSPLYLTYGMTETVSHVAMKRLNGVQKQDFFECLPSNTITVDDRGCLVIQSPVLSSTLYTNDQVELISPTKFRWLGRADNVINSGGLKFQLEKVESAAEIALFGLRDHNRAVAIGFPDEKLGERLELVIESPPFSEQKKDQLMDVLSDSLEKYELPKAIRFLTRFPETDSGKVDRIKIMGILKNESN